MRVAIVLSGGLRADSELPDWVIARCDVALELECDRYVICSRYSRNLPQKISSDGYVVCENQKIAEYLIGKGVDSSKVLLESFSTDTIGSAVFAAMILSAIKYDRARCFLITSDWHIARASAIFQWIFDIKFKGLCDLRYVGVQGPAINLTQRANREALALARFHEEWYGLSSFHDVLTHMFQSHADYSMCSNEAGLSPSEMSNLMY